MLWLVSDPDRWWFKIGISVQDLKSRISVVRTFWASFHVWNLWIGNENLNPRDGILGASMGLSKNFAHWCLSGETACTFSIFVRLGESIYSVLVESGRLFFVVEVVDTNYWRYGYRLRFVVVRMDWKWSRRGGRVTKRQMSFLCLTRQTGILWVPPGVELWDCYWGRYFETGFWI